MAKLVTVTIDQETGDFSVDLTGFHGNGCADVAEAFAELGMVTKDVKKPEFKAKQVNTVRK